MIRAVAALCLILASATATLHAAGPRDFAVDLKATVSDTAPHITLAWTQRVQTNITAQKIHRRLKGETAWVKLADLTTTQTSYSDATAAPNVEYEYWMERNLTGLTPNVAMGYLSAGVKVPEVHNRGTLLLLVDDTMVTPLAPEIDQLKLDLAGDGWTVQQITALRTDTAASTKALITAAYGADPANVKAVYLLGHVPVPYSGNQAPDGHGDHVGAWPADGYYGEMNGTWTDTAVNNTSASRTQNDNIPGDGKFDQISFPSLVELQVGRVDLHTLNRSPVSGVSETAKLRRYLRRSHDFRHKLGAYSAIPRRSLIRDGFGHAFTSEPFAVTAWMGAFACVGQAPDAPIDEAPSGQWFSATYAGGKDYLWGHGCGGGSYESASSFGTSSEIGRNTSRVVFTSVFGSYHGDWDADNNLMRTIIAGNATGDSLGLTCFWAGRPNWFPHHPGMGETMGYMTRVSMNGGLTGGGGYVPGGTSYWGVHIGLMGDPALRMHIVEPPRRLAAHSSSGQIHLSWAASNESSFQGYHVYRAASPAGPFSKLTITPQAGTTYTDGAVTPGDSYTYLVRTLKLESVPGGSYYNLSVGSPVSLTARSLAAAPPLNPSDLAVSTPTSSPGAAMTWQDNSSDENGFRIERKTNSNGAFGTLTMVAANTTSFTDPGPLTQGNVYYYRVIATGPSGDSIASNESSFDAVAGFVEFTTTKTKVNKSAGSVTLNVPRFGGSVGAIAVNYATSNSSAVAGTHYTSTSGTLNWADGDGATKTITVPVTNTGTPQLPRQFKVTLSSPTNGAVLAQWVSVAVQIEDPSATLDPAWTSTLIGTITDSSPAVSAEGVMFGDSTMGGSGVSSSATSEAGRFIYQNRTGDGIITMQVPTPATAQSGARFAVMVRATIGNTAIMAATVGASAAANHGTKLAYRSTVGGNATATPATDNNQDTPQWLRLTRTGSSFTSESSTDGSTWTVLGSATLSSMPAAAVWGIFHYSNDWASSSTYLGDYQLATYQNISITGLPAPATPAGFAISTVSNASVQLNWTVSSFAAGYRIERRGDDGSLDVLPEITPGTTATFTDNTIRSDTAYEYRILAFNSAGESSWSAAIRTMTPAADTEFVVTTADAGGADATLRYDSPTTNFGATTSLPVTATAVADASLTPVTKSWLRFNLGSIPTLKSARLKLAYLGEENLQAAFDNGGFYWMTANLLAETSDTWDESTIQWNTAPQNNTTGAGVIGTSQQVASYFHFDTSTLPAVNSTVTFTLTASTLNTNRGANNLLTLALVPAASQSGAMIWASHENTTLPPPTLEVSTASTQPKRPGFLSAMPGSGSNVALNWYDTTSDETGFRLERRTANGEWMLLAAVMPDVTTFTDTTSLPGVIYDYRLRASTSAGDSSWATVSSITHTGAASITGAIYSTDGVTFSRADTALQNAYVPTSLSYYTPASNFVTSQTLSTTIRNNFAGWLGMKITTGASPVVVRELGRWVIAGNTGTHTVKIVNAATSTDLPGGSVSIATAGAPTGFAYAPLSVPVTLAANSVWFIVSQEVDGGDQWYEGGNTLTYATAIATVNQSVYSGNGTTYTTAYSANNSYIPLTFKYSAAAAPFISSHAMTRLRNDVTGWCGMEITTGSTVLSVAELARWIVAGNTATHTVKLVESVTGTTLGSVSIATAGAPAGEFKYAALPSTITLSPNRSYYVLSQETAGGDQWYDFATAAPGNATPFQQWLLAHGLPMDGSGSGSATASPCNDGLTNLIKYALGLDPGVSGPSGRLASATVNDGSGEYLAFTYIRPEPAPASVTYRVEGSSDLSAASWSDTGIVPVSSFVNGGLRTITVRDSTPMSVGNQRFLRLKVTQP